VAWGTLNAKGVIGTVGKLWIASAAVVVAGFACAAPADAQRVWQNNRWVSMPPQSRPAPNIARPDYNRPIPGPSGWNRPNPGRPGFDAGRHHRWNMVNGRWDAGWRAPGGWNGYRRLGRGGHLPNYWRGADFRIADYLSYGLASPPPGYFWSRYYDDAVLVDGRGEVWDSIDGISWIDAEADAGYGEAYAVAGSGYAAPRIEPVAPGAYYDAPPPPAYSAPIPYPAPGAYIAPPPPPPVVQAYPAPVATCVQGCAANGAYYNGTFYGGGVTTTTTGGYGATTTTVVITPAPITTTTITEEVVQERVVKTSYVRRPVRKVRYRKPSCCQCLCR
jgi:Ni/Co efflux regulator RcnB